MTTLDEQEDVRPAATASGGGRTRSAWRSQWWVLLLAIYCIGFAVTGGWRYVIFDESISLASPARPELPWQYPIIALHVIFGAIAISTAWVQVWPWFRNNHPRWHRRIGYVYFGLGVFPSGILAFPVAFLATSGHGPRMVLGVMGVLWMISSVAGLRAARGRRFDDHRRWMLRSVALTTCIATARPFVYGQVALLGWLLPDTYPASRDTFVLSEAMGLFIAMMIHLVFVEWYLLRPKRRARRASQARTPVAAEPTG
ncbi:hypothetical protein ALI22I_29370 [Saccharothrix sp. ALI-22-I]|uniref:DUF2306 domain-containing protein n=1 Tax=Saccharothrix sp. ALI-22-I TaxID=1933778 RepID=UPI00097C7FA7|nr:DUF2306 domain-containing protein [Saccharothrix sp. ALI-22-I]ONI84651.1 hypothetical protein ALI22I_29370 [Saccharothrix sp. ALI-22-I]